MSGIDVFGRNVDYYAAYDEITGINSASPILVQGVKVGKVTEIMLDPAKSDKVILKLSIKRRYEIPTDSKVRIFSPDLMSSMAIGLDLGESSTTLKAGDRIESYVEPDLMSLASDKLVEITDMISQLGGELTKAMESVNAMLSDNKESINSTMSNLNDISGDMSSLLSSQNKNIENAIDGLSKFSTSLGDNAQNIDEILANLSALSEELAEANIASSLGTTLAELNTTLDKVNSAEGSAGLLLSDEQLYNNLAALSASLNELFIDMQSNPKRYVHFSLFGSKE